MATPRRMPTQGELEEYALRYQMLADEATEIVQEGMQWLPHTTSAVQHLAQALSALGQASHMASRAAEIFAANQPPVRSDDPDDDIVDAEVLGEDTEGDSPELSELEA